MPPKKAKGKKSKAKKRTVDPNRPKTPPLHTLWDLHTLHSAFTDQGRDLAAARASRKVLEEELSELKSDHQVTFEKFQAEFDVHKSKMSTLVAAAKESEDRRKESEQANKTKMSELSIVTREAQSTVGKISREWKEKQSLIRDAETAVVRNAQLEIENSQLNRTVAELKGLVKKREKQLFVVSKARSVPVREDYGKPGSGNGGGGGGGGGEEGEEGEGGGEDQEKTEKTDYTLAMVPMLLEAMRQFPHVLLVQQQSVSMLSSQLKTLDDCLALDRFYCLDLVIVAMQKHRDAPLLQT